MDFKDFLKNAAHVKPSAKQLQMLRETPFYAFIHFSPNTYTNLEWGDGTEDPAIFNPTDLDCEQWVKAIKSAGMKGVVLTAKHHDGFCLWQTEYTEHSMKSSPYKNGKGDIVKETAEACKKHGLKFGFYLSPWDRNSKLYGTDEYNTYYKNQLTELLTNYGEIFYVWFDGACGEGPNGKKQIYDFEGYIELIEKYQPNAAIFHDTGIIRWCGNEAGKAPYAQWAVVPKELCSMNKPQTEGALVEGDLSFNYNSDIAIGSLETIIYSKGLVFAPAETDMSIRPGWFYHENEKPHSLERLFNTYLNSVGNNTTFNLNIPPMPNGKFNEADVERLKELGEMLENEFGTNLAEGCEIEVLPGFSETQPEFIVKLNGIKSIKYVELAERISEGQRISNFAIHVKNKDGYFDKAAQGTTVGSRKIVEIDPTETDEIKIRIMASRDVPDLEWIKVY
ncbi:MAG: alpha-L-fucosidase [Clostridia bacterium]|nr:alpha-L-fucosidase [Clostridia bacterium]